MVKPRKKYKSSGAAAFTPSYRRRTRSKKDSPKKPWGEFSGSTDENFEQMRRRASAHKSDRGAKYASGTANLGLWEQGKTFLGPYVGHLGSMAAMAAYTEAHKLMDKGLREADKKYRSVGEDVKRWFGGIAGLGSRETGSTPDLALYTRQVAPPLAEAPNSLGLAGEMFSNRWHVDDGPHSKTLATAVNLYKERSMTLWETNYETPNWFNSQISQAGINRRGWYAPWLGACDDKDYLFTHYQDPDLFSNGGIYDSVGTIGVRHIYNFVRENLSTDVINYIQGSNTSDSDLLFPITRTRSTHRIQNNLTESEVEVTAYLLKCKYPVRGFPVGHMFNFGLPNPVAPGTVWPSNYAPQNGQDGPYYWERRNVGVPAADPGSASVLAKWQAEVNTCPAVTPYLSPYFREHWEICDVMHQRLQPADSWEVIFQRNYRHPCRWNVFKGFFADVGGAMPDADNLAAAGYYWPGDYEIVFSHAGLDGIVSGFETGKMTGTGEDDDPLVIENLAPRNVDCKRSRISKTVHHEISAAWPTLVLSGKQPTPSSAAELEDKGFITATQRVPDTALASADFSRTLTNPTTGATFEVANWPAIGGNDAPPRVGTTKSQITGESQIPDL